MTRWKVLSPSIRSTPFAIRLIHDDGCQRSLIPLPARRSISARRHLVPSTPIAEKKNVETRKEKQLSNTKRKKKKRKRGHFSVNEKKYRMPALLRMNKRGESFFLLKKASQKKWSMNTNEKGLWMKIPVRWGTWRLNYLSEEKNISILGIVIIFGRWCCEAAGETLPRPADVSLDVVWPRQVDYLLKPTSSAQVILVSHLWQSRWNRLHSRTDGAE